MAATTNKAGGDELKKALIAIRRLRQQVSELEGLRNEPIAIVGQSCRLPGGASTPDEYWRLLRDGVDATCEVPADRWDADAFYDADHDAAGKSYVRRGGFLTVPVDEFDASFFGISPREAEAMDPLHRLLLELAWESLENAGIPPDSLAGSLTGVFAGLSGSDYNQLQSKSGGDVMHVYRGTGTAACIGSGRISYILNLHGPNVAIDTACSSGLVALAQAVDALRARHCDLALAGSSHLMLSPDTTVFLCRMQALSADGKCRTFDAGANGYGRAEGGLMFVLKRLKDAIAAGDTVQAVIRGSAYNHDGRSSGLTVPNPAAQRAVIKAALANAGLEPAAIDYVEAHGTATELGDPIELRALDAVLCGNRTTKLPLLVGSAKTNFGHLEAAAGLAGLMKVVLSLQHEELPAHLHFARPTPHVDWDRLPIRVVTEARPWPAAEVPRRAGVSAFGFSGTNAHVIVENAPADERPALPERPVHLVAVSARTPIAVRQLAARYRAALAAQPAMAGDLAAAATAGRTHHPCRSAAVGRDAAELDRGLARIESADDRELAGARDTDHGGIVFMFAGQGTQRAAMAGELWETSPVFRDAVCECAQIVDPVLGLSLVDLLTDADAAAALDDTAVAQPVLFAFEWALAKLWMSWGVEPDYVIGHSLGEYVAATVAGVMDLATALPLVLRRGRLMADLDDDGCMAAVFTGADIVAPKLTGSVAIAALNAPENTVVSGPAAEVATVLESLAAEGHEHRYLDVARAFHSSLMDPVLDDFEREIESAGLRAPTIPLASNLTGKLLTPEDAVSTERWRRHIREPVRFFESIETLHELGARCFIEIGPQATLCALGAAARPGSDACWLPSRRQDGCWQQLAESLGTLYARGYSVDWQGWCRGFAGTRSGGPLYPFQRQPYWFTQDRRAGTTTAATALDSPGRRTVLYDIEWQAAPPCAELTDSELSGNWLVLADNGGVGSELAAAVVAAGGSAVIVRRGESWQVDANNDYVIAADRPDDLLRVLGECRARWPESRDGVRLVHCWGLDATEHAAASGVQQVADATALLTPLLAVARHEDAARLLASASLLTRSVAGPGTEAQSPATACGAVLWGALPVLQAELPEVAASVVDIGSHAVDTGELLQRLAGSGREDRLSRQAGSWFVPRLSEVDVPPVAAGDGPVIRADAAYVVTGATGGIGRELVGWLVRKGAGTVVAMARSELSAADRRWLSSLESEGTRTVWHQGDAADDASIAALSDVLGGLQQPLAGVFHTAGVLDDALLVDQTPERVAAVLRPKIAGAWNLQRMTADQSLDYFVQFSSIARHFGGPGQSSYAAANAFLGTLTELRVAAGRNALTVDWGAWATGGMAARMSAADKRRMIDSGIEFMESAQAMQILEQALASGRTRLIVPAIDWHRAAALTPRLPALLDGVIAASAASAPMPATAPADDYPDAASLRAADAGAREVLVADFVRHALDDILRLPRGSILEGTPVAEMGFDSMLATEFRNRLERTTGVIVPISRLLGDATPASIAASVLALFDAVAATPAAMQPSGAVEEGEI